VEERLETIWMVARIDLGFDDGAPQRALVEVFQAIGHDDPRVLSYQQRLSVLLCPQGCGQTCRAEEVGLLSAGGQGQAMTRGRLRSAPGSSRRIPI